MKVLPGNSATRTAPAQPIDSARAAAHPQHDRSTSKCVAPRVGADALVLQTPDSGLAQRCAIQAAQLSLLSSVAEALTRTSDPDAVLRDVLAATLNAAGISKGALMLRDGTGVLTLRQDSGFSESERSNLQSFFGHGALLDQLVNRGESVRVPSSVIPDSSSRDILAGANVTDLQIVPLKFDGQGVGAMLIGATSKDAIVDDSVAFARAMGNQILQSLAVAKSVASLSQQRDQAQRYLDTADVMLLALDPEGRITLINRKGCSVLGWTESELVGRDFIETCVPARIRDTTRQMVSNVHAGNDAVVEHAIVTRTGDERLIEWRSSLQRDDEGRIVSTLSSGTDITDRSRAETLVRLQSAALNAAANAMVITNRAGIIEWVNPAFSGLTGYSAAEAVGKNPRDLVRSDQHDQPFYMNLWDTILSGQVWRGEMINRRKDGTLYTEEQTITPLRDSQGEIRHFIDVKQDVTERRTLERQFQQAQKMEAVGRLAGGVAHDFNNLLTVILGYCEVLLSELTPGDPHHAFVEEMHRAGERAAGLTRQLLAFSRKQIIEPTQLDLNVVTTDILPMLERLIGEDIQVVLGLQPDLALVTADRGQVEQILMNLAVNARDAMPKGGTLTVETANIDLDEDYAAMHLDVHPGRYVVISVADTGTGMTPEVQARLFEPFFTTKEPGKGTGLGLATVYGIVTRSGGSVGVYSEIGQGTAFKVYFPRLDAAELVAHNAAPVVRPRAGTQTVLVVEDEDGLRELAQRLLQRLGYTVLAAANAHDALRLFTANQAIDVILTDVVMPGASGPELIRQMVAERPDLRVIYMSGYTEDAIVQHGILQPGIAFLNKPFTSRALGEKIRDVLDR